MEDRRLAAILAADIAGYSALMGADEEATVRALKRQQGIVLPMIKDHGGRVIDTAGDGILAEFASVINAVKCGAAIQKVMTERNSGVHPERRMQYRIGINLGDVVYDETRIYGDGINIAARLESIAEPGAICISGKVHEEIAGKLDLTIEDMGEVSLKNIPRPVHVYRITGEPKKEAISRITKKNASVDSIFVGRQIELDALRRSLNDATEGRGRLVMLVGEPGIGKSRTAYELAAQAAERRFQILWGRCSEEPGAPPYWPWVQIIRSYVRDCDAKTLMVDMGPGAADIVDVVPEIGGRLTSLKASAPLADPAAARFRLFDAIARFLKNVARRRPLLLVLDDLHWADAPSLRLLQFVGPELEASRCVLLGTYRDIELSRKHPLSDTLGVLTRLHIFERLQLTGLGKDDVASLMESAAGMAPPPSLVSAVQSEAEGNPFFLKEIVAYLVQEKVLQPGRSQSSDKLGRARGFGVRIPEGVKEVIGKRLNRLSAGCNEMLTIASVVGRQFDFDVVRRLLDDKSEDRVLTMLEEALAARVIEELPPPAGRYQFSHALIRETLYEELITMRRVRLHRRIGEILEAIHKTDLNPYIPQLAHHFCEAAQAGGADKAVEYALRAGNLADSLLAFEEAARLQEMALIALELNDVVDEARRCSILLMLGEAQRKANEFERALDAFHRAANSAKAAGLLDTYVRAGLGIEQVLWRTGRLADSPVIKILREALRWLDLTQVQHSSNGETPKALRCRVLSALARALVNMGAGDEAATCAAQAVAGARELADPAVLAASLACKFDFPWEPAATEELLADAAEMLRAAEQVGNVELIARARSARFVYRLELGDIVAAEAEIDSLLRLDPRIRQPTYALVLLGYRFTLALLRGRFNEAEQRARETLEFAAHGTQLDFEGHFGLQMFSLRREQGRLREIAPILSVITQQLRGSATWRPGLALIYTELGRLDEARAELEDLARNDFKSVVKDGLWSTSIAYLAEVSAVLGDVDRAATIYRLLLPYRGRCIGLAGGATACGTASRYLGLMASTMRRFQEAERHFDEALAMSIRMRAGPEVAHTQYEYATMLLGRAQPGDRERAADLLRTALAATEELGMRALSEKISAKIGDISKASTPDPAYPDELTAREVAVLRLIAIGRSNSDIATALSISNNTVATHVRSILAKTGSANRTEAAAYAVRHGLAKLS